MITQQIEETRLLAESTENELNDLKTQDSKERTDKQLALLDEVIQSSFPKEIIDSKIAEIQTYESPRTQELQDRADMLRGREARLNDEMIAINATNPVEIIQ